MFFVISLSQYSYLQHGWLTENEPRRYYGLLHVAPTFQLIILLYHLLAQRITIDKTSVYIYFSGLW